MRTKTSLSALLFATAVLTGAAACGDDPDVGTSADEIIGGVPARSPKLNAVGAIGFDDFGTGSFRPVCTGTLIAPTMVLTAEHCVDFVSDPTLQLKFLIGFDAYHPIRSVPVKGVSMEQSSWGGVIGLGIDMAIMHLAEPVTDVTPFPVAEPTDAQLDLRFAGIGYGRQDSLGTHGTRMTGSMTFQARSGHVFEVIYGSFEEFVAQLAPRWGVDASTPEGLAVMQFLWDTRVLLDGGVEGWFGGAPRDAQACFGDSGGPITKAVNGQPTVYGVASWVAFSDANRLCDLGAAYATVNPTALDFIAYESKCPLIPRGGHCADVDTVERCATLAEGGYRPLQTDCDELGLICGYDEAGELGCVDDPCVDLPADGVCQGDVAVRCTADDDLPRRLDQTDCAALGGSCEVGAEGAECVGIECAHELCTVGDPLVPECSDCVAAVCEIDAYCCEVAWDEICVGEFPAICEGEAACPGTPIVAPGSRQQ